MGAANIGFPRFVGKNETIWAAKITDMTTDQATGYTVIQFGDIGKQTIATAEWVGIHQPQIGGYMAVTDKGICTFGRFMPEDEFKSYRPSPKPELTKSSDELTSDKVE